VLPLPQRLLKYLAEFVGEPSPLVAENSKRLPLFLRERFQLRATALWGRRVLFAVEDESWEPGAPGDYEKLAASLRSQVGEPVVLVIARMPAYARNRLVRIGIPFVVPGAQFFLPLVLVDLRERFSSPKTVKGKRLTPAAQSLVLYHLQRESLEHQPLKDLATAIGYSPIMLTKVKDELEGAELCRSARHGRSITLDFPLKGRNLWERAQPYLTSPVKKTHWLRWNHPGRPALTAGLTALSRLTSIADDQLPTFALSSEGVHSNLEKGTFHGCGGPEEADVRMESWAYDPVLLGKDGQVDSLSLFLSLRESVDERVQQQTAKLITQFSW